MELQKKAREPDPYFSRTEFPEVLKSYHFYLQFWGRLSLKRQDNSETDSFARQPGNSSAYQLALNLPLTRIALCVFHKFPLQFPRITLTLQSDNK